MCIGVVFNLCTLLERFPCDNNLTKGRWAVVFQLFHWNLQQSSSLHFSFPDFFISRRFTYLSEHPHLGSLHFVVIRPNNNKMYIIGSVRKYYGNKLGIELTWKIEFSTDHVKMNQTCWNWCKLVQCCDRELIILTAIWCLRCQFRSHRQPVRF